MHIAHTHPPPACAGLLPAQAAAPGRQRFGGHSSKDKGLVFLQVMSPTPTNPGEFGRGPQQQGDMQFQEAAGT